MIGLLRFFLFLLCAPLAPIFILFGWNPISLLRGGDDSDDKDTLY